MVYDCFSFFNELDLLEIRLNTLDSVVDKFVLVEATKTHNGKDKPLVYNENAKRFARFHDKIIHIVVDSFPEFESSWTFENYQRNQIVRGLHGAKEDDVVLLSDIDEIPNPKLVKKYSSRPGRYVFRQITYCYYFNCRRILVNLWHYGLSPYWEGTQMMTVGDFLHLYDSIPCPDGIFYLRPAVNEGTTASKIRFLREVPFHYVNDGGWHFTSLGGVTALRNKLKAYAHQERSVLLSKSPEEMENLLYKGIDPMTGERVFFCDIKKGLPPYVYANIERFRPYVFDTKERGTTGSIIKLRFLVLVGVIIGKKNLLKHEMIRLAKSILPQKCFDAFHSLENRAVRRSAKV